MKRVKFNSSLLMLSLCMTGTAWSAKELDIIQIKGQFDQASYAASKCSTPNKETLIKHKVNYDAVNYLAQEELKRRNPELTNQQIDTMFSDGAKNVERAIGEAINQNGCKDPRVQDLLKQFDMQAKSKHNKI